MTLFMQKPQLAIVTGQLTNKVGIYLFVVVVVVFYPIQKRIENFFSPFLGCWPNSTK